ncbi:hypothetical protein QBC32DRAFT_338031 [Pseudoneurospora amorphoporcata]|uniref:Uncharacterized protein n=1 Tax=Pseudoneurospora amorphoporcata TaxID=241081 RepID=A0AAN6SHD0_9PEZI|nr:hypothetical protein QBC32DRAFT_338031 [Pseudoneurospora amorphoporcata]
MGRSIEELQDPATLVPSLALKFIPIVELDDSFNNFDEWEHSIRFYLRYHGLLTCIEGGGTDEDLPFTPDEILHRRLFVYSLIWKSAVAILYLRFVMDNNLKNLKNQLFQNHQHDPKQLWDTLHAHKDAIQNPKALRLHSR